MHLYLSLIGRSQLRLTQHRSCLRLCQLPGKRRSACLLHARFLDKYWLGIFSGVIGSSLLDFWYSYPAPGLLLCSGYRCRGPGLCQGFRQCLPELDLCCRRRGALLHWHVITHRQMVVVDGLRRGGGSGSDGGPLPWDGGRRQNGAMAIAMELLETWEGDKECSVQVLHASRRCTLHHPQEGVPAWGSWSRSVIACRPTRFQEAGPVAHLLHLLRVGGGPQTLVKDVSRLDEALIG